MARQKSHHGYYQLIHKFMEPYLGSSPSEILILDPSYQVRAWAINYTNTSHVLRGCNYLSMVGSVRLIAVSKRDLCAKTSSLHMFGR